MAKLVKKDKRVAEAEEQFLSLVFPMKKKWIAPRPGVGRRKSSLKRTVAAAVAGGGHSGNQEGAVKADK